MKVMESMKLMAASHDEGEAAPMKAMRRRRRRRRKSMKAMKATSAMKAKNRTMTVRNAGLL